MRPLLLLMLVLRVVRRRGVVLGAAQKLVCCIPMIREGEWSRRRTSNLVFSAIILCIPIPTPSITASNIPHPIAEFLAAFMPPRMASAPPVKKPAMTVLLLALIHPASYTLSPTL